MGSPDSKQWRLKEKAYKDLIQNLREQRTFYSDGDVDVVQGGQTFVQRTSWKSQDGIYPVTALKMKETNEGRYFIGKVIEKAFYIPNFLTTQLLLSDPFGDLIYVSIVDASVSDCKTALQQYPVGRIISIKEPRLLDAVGNSEFQKLVMVMDAASVSDAAFPTTAAQRKEYDYEPCPKQEAYQGLIERFCDLRDATLSQAGVDVHEQGDSSSFVQTAPWNIEEGVFPVSASSLKDVNKGRYFLFKIIEKVLWDEDECMVQMLTKDPFGDLVSVGIYQFEPDCIERRGSKRFDILSDKEVQVFDWKTALENYPVGRVIAIKDPWMHHFDGKYTRIISLHSTQLDHVSNSAFPNTAQQWKEYGNGFFDEKVKEYEVASQCYDKALGCLEKECQNLSILFSNRALCHAKLDQWVESIRCSSVAISLDPTNSKAAHRQCKALLVAGRADEAKSLTALCYKKWPKDFKDLLRM